MPSLENLKTNLRVLIVGDPSAGKTVAATSIAKQGQKIFMANFDNNWMPIGQFVPKQFHKNIHVETCLDKVHFNSDGRPYVKGTPTAFTKFSKLSDKWVDSETGEDFGSPEDWDSNSWVMLDPLGDFGEACMWLTLFKRGQMGEKKSMPAWGQAMDLLYGTLIKYKEANVNFICTAHLARLSDPSEDDENDKGPKKKKPDNLLMRYPVCLGRKLPPIVGSQFNVILQAKRVGTGQNARRVLCTVPDTDVDVKVPLPPKTVPAEVPIDQLWSILKHFKGE